MTNLWWLAVICAVAIAALADSVSALWARQPHKLSIYFVLLLLLGPLVFMAFGIVTTKFGLAITSAVVNSLLVLTSITVGLVAFNEWQSVSVLQYVGMALAVTGVGLMLFFSKEFS